MFWEVTLNQSVRIHPLKLASDLTSTTIEGELRNIVEGMITAETGIILTVQKIEDIGDGIVSQRTGYAIYDVKYRALIFRPLPNQVLDAFIISVNEQGIKAAAGPLEIFIAKKCISPGFDFDIENTSFTKKVKNETDNSIYTIVLMKGTRIRVKIINTKPHTDFTKLTATATINDKGLGFIQ